MKKLLVILIAFSSLNHVAWANPISILNDSNLPPEFEASYDVYKGTIRAGKMVVSLKKQGDELIYESTTTPVGMAAFFLGKQVVKDRTILKLLDNQYHAIEFKHVMENSDKNRNEHYIFDWENKKVTVEYKDRKNEFDLPEFTFDNYSAQLLLMRQPDNENTSYRYSVISKGRLKEYFYQLEKNQTIETKVGTFNAHKFIRKKDNEKKTTYLGWYAEELNYIPAKLDKFENGKLDVSIQITGIKWLNQTTSH